MPEIIVMPELPEVETIKKGVTPFLLNQRIERMVVRRKQLRWPIPEVIQQLENVLITQVARRAKYLLITTEQGQLLVHLGMSGVLRIVPQGTPAKDRKSTRLNSSHVSLSYAVFCLQKKSPHA